jgi:protoporphyrinogen oxidase
VTRCAVIAGAGPAGLTAALELLSRSDVQPIVIEADDQVGGIAKTIEYRGNRMDLGGHRFFSKSDWVMRWWESILPIAHAADKEPIHLKYQGQESDYVPSTQSPEEKTDRVMLVRNRMSRIFYRRRLFDYPLKLSLQTVRNLGPLYMARISASYVRARLLPRTPEATLEDFLVNRFGNQLYRTFFKDYTEKVWGVPCRDIAAEWGAQRIKGLSIGSALRHALMKPLRQLDTRQKHIETSLIERFLYPKHGPGQMWEEVAARVVSRGGKLHLCHRVVNVVRDARTITAVDIEDSASGAVRRLGCDYLISSMPITELVRQLAPEEVQVATTAAHLPYRDFMTAGLLVRRMTALARGGANQSGNGMPPDNWIYIQEPDVKLGRLQIFNNWSPALVADPNTIWLGLEYFCTQGDEIWSLSDGAFLLFAASELEKIGLISRSDVLDGTVVRVPRAYPAYFGHYSKIGDLRAYLDSFANLLPVGRNGMHRYNNQDHSMLTAKAAVDCIIKGDSDRSQLWAVNAEDNYLEATTDAD